MQDEDALIRMPEGKAILGIKSNSSWYDYIARGIIPPGIRIDPSIRSVFWSRREIIAIRDAAVQRARSMEAA